jgi:hypothetical protein
MNADNDFQARGVSEGRKAQEIAASVLQGAGFVVVASNMVHRPTGATVNLVAKDGAGDEWFFDVSGSFSSERAGLLRTDTVWKCLGRASVLSASGIERLVLLTTNLPERGTVGAKALTMASATFFDAVEMLSADGKFRLRRYAEGSRSQPLPGIRPADALYPSLRRVSTDRWERVELLVTELQDPLPDVSISYDVVSMPYRIKVVVPSIAQDGTLIHARTRRSVGEKLVGLLSTFAGGCTGVEAIGSWVDPVGGVVHENVSVVEAYATAPFPEDLLRQAVDLVIGSLRQMTAAVVINDTMVLFSPSAPADD